MENVDKDEPKGSNNQNAHQYGYKLIKHQKRKHIIDFFRHKKTNQPCTILQLNSTGFTLIELMITIAIIGVLSAVAIPNYLKYKFNASIASVISEIRIIERMIAVYEADNGNLPDNLSEINIEAVDPWGNPYKYLNLEAMNEKGNSKDEDKPKGKPEGEPRKDHFLVPVNSDYDLYSMGADGKSAAPFTAKASRDDIVRANDGNYVGLASDF